MKPSLALAAHRTEIREIVLAHRAVNARVFQGTNSMTCANKVFVCVHEHLQVIEPLEHA